jgi:hypothetical protein
MPLSFEEKKNIRRQLTQDLGRTPTDKEFSGALMEKFPEAYLSAQQQLPPANINPFSTNPEDFNYADPSKKRVKMTNSVSGQEVDAPEIEAIDQELKQEKEQGRGLFNSGKTEKLLKLKPLNDTNNYPSLDRVQGTSMHDLLQMDTAPEISEKSQIQIPFAEGEQQVKLPTDDEQLRDIYNSQGDFQYNTPQARSIASEQPQKELESNKPNTTTQTPTSLEDDEFKKASQQADYNQAQARLMSAVGGLSTSLANLGNIGTPIENKFKEGTDDLLKHAGDPISRLKEQREQYEQLIKNKDLKESRDPNSGISQSYRDFANLLGIKHPNNATAADLAKLTPLYEKYRDRQDSIQARKEAAKALYDFRIEQAKEKLETKDKEHFEKAAKYMEEDEKKLNTRTGKELARFTGGQHALSIVQDYKDLNKVPEQFKRELAVALGSMISPGLVHKETIDQLDPKTLEQTLQGYVTKVTGKPYGAGGAGIVKLAIESIKKQMAVSSSVLRNESDRKLRVYKKILSEPSYKELEDIVKTKDFYEHASGDDIKLTNKDVKKVTLKDGETIIVRPEDLDQISKDDILKVE